MIAHSYWLTSHSESRFDVGNFIREDLARPLFEPYGFCGGWTHSGFGLSAVFGLDFPAFIAATAIHSLVNWAPSCVDALTTPRGHTITTALVLPLWFFVGLSIRRLAQGRWRQRAASPARSALLALGLIPLPLGLLLLLLSVLGFLVSDLGTSLRLAGIAFWFLYVSALAAERLRTWPFDRIPSGASQSPGQPGQPPAGRRLPRFTTTLKVHD